MTEHVIVTNLRERLAVVERDRDAACAEVERLRSLLGEALAGWEELDQWIADDRSASVDGPASLRRDEIRREAGLT